MPGEVSKQRFASNDLNFVLQQGLLEAHYMDVSRKASGDKLIYEKWKAAFQASENVYPPLEYQELCASKINYSEYLTENKLSVLPTFSLTAKDYNQREHDASMKKVFDFWQREGLGNVIAKPVLGMGGADIKFFKDNEEGRSALSRYFRRNMKRYPGLIVQKAIKGFGNEKECPELRMYFMGDQYKYSVSANKNAVCSHPVAEGGTLEMPLKRLKAVTQKIITKLPHIVMPNGARVPRLITRLDMGWRVEGRYQLFLNEIELCPSLYVYKPLKEELTDYIACCAKQIVKISRLYMKQGRGASAKFQQGRSHQREATGVKKHHFLKHRPFSARS